MKRVLLFLAITTLALGDAEAQNFRKSKDKEKEADSDPSRQLSWGRVTPSESMWMYEQQKRDYLDPTLAMRRRAEFNAWQRRHRLAAQRWFGYSNSRPNWHPTPFMSLTPSPAWSGNDYYDRYRWQTGTPWWVVVEPSESLYREVK